MEDVPEKSHEVPVTSHGNDPADAAIVAAAEERARKDRKNNNEAVFKAKETYLSNKLIKEINLKKMIVGKTKEFDGRKCGALRAARKVLRVLGQVAERGGSAAEVLEGIQGKVKAMKDEVKHERKLRKKRKIVRNGDEVEEGNANNEDATEDDNSDDEEEH